METEMLMKMEAVRAIFSSEEDGKLTEGGRQLLSAMEEVTFLPGEELMRYGEPGDDGMYLLLEGKADVLDGGGNTINLPMTPGSIVGEMALIRDEPRGATVRAITKVVCAHLSKDQFEEAARRNKKLYGALLNLAYKKTTSLVAEQARLHSELEIAARIQTGLLRHDFTEIESKLTIEIAAFMEPAKEVGGDFYDVFLISGKRACVVMADVSGKGVPAAMFMAMAKTHIKNYGMLDMPLHELMYRVNNHLCEDNPEEMFVTAFVGILDMEQEVMTFINAGHNRPYFAQKNGVFTQLACSSDLVLGLWEEQKYREQTVEFKKGTRFFLYTDGVTEAENESEEMFGDDRLCETLNRHRGDGDAKQFSDGVYKDLERFVGNASQTDDITMLYLTAPDRKMLERTVPARLDYMDDMIEALDEYLKAENCPQKILTELEISLEEIFTNIASYAYEKEDGELSLCCRLEQGGGEFTMQFKDWGNPFNPVEKRDPDFTVPFDERPIGGLGIYMVKNFADEVGYEYRDGCNILTVRKKIHP